MAQKTFPTNYSEKEILNWEEQVLIWDPQAWDRIKFYKVKNSPIPISVQEALNEKLTSVVAWTNITIDDTDPNNPIINSSGSINSDPTWVIGADQVTNVMSLTQAEYDAITPDTATFYIITDA